MFDYETLVNPVRRLVNDTPRIVVDHVEETMNDSYYVSLSEDGWATPIPGGVVVDGSSVADDDYTIVRNIIKFSNIIPAQSDVFVQYEIVHMRDQDVIGHIDDSVHNLVEVALNEDFGFGVSEDGGAGDDNVTYKSISSSVKSLITHGAAAQIVGSMAAEFGDDSIKVVDGDTSIDSTSQSREMNKTHKTMIDRYENLLKKILTNEYDGVTML